MPFEHILIGWMIYLQEISIVSDWKISLACDRLGYAESARRSNWGAPRTLITPLSSYIKSRAAQRV